MERKLEIGMGVVFIDELRRERDALVTAYHGNPRGAVTRCKKDEAGKEVADDEGYLVMEDTPGTEGTDWPSVNLVVVDSNEGAQDQYGRQISHPSSVVHWTNNSAQGFCWRFRDERMTGVAAPTVS